MHIRQRAHRIPTDAHTDTFLCGFALEFCCCAWQIRTLVMCRQLLLLSWNNLLRWSIFSLMQHKTTRVEWSHHCPPVDHNVRLLVVLLPYSFWSTLEHTSFDSFSFQKSWLDIRAREGGGGSMQPEAGRKLAAYLFMTGFNWNPTSSYPVKCFKTEHKIW